MTVFFSNSVGELSPWPLGPPTTPIDPPNPPNHPHPHPILTQGPRLQLYNTVYQLPKAKRPLHNSFTGSLKSKANSGPFCFQALSGTGPVPLSGPFCNLSDYVFQALSVTRPYKLPGPFCYQALYVTRPFLLAGPFCYLAQSVTRPFL